MKYLLAFVAPAAALLFQAGGNLDTVTLNHQACGLTGLATSTDGKELNRHKNRYDTPGAGDMDPHISLAAMLAPGNDVGRFDQNKAAQIRGYVVAVQVGGKETCNCKAPDPKERDTHFELALAGGTTPGTQHLVAEVTPRFRMLMGEKHVDWTTDALRKEYQGKWVEITGWLLFDFAHIKEAENTNPGNPANWRATCWEIHPITSIKVLPGPPIAAAGFQPASFSALQGLHAAHVAASPAGRAALARLHESYLSKLDPEERKEVEEEAQERRPRQP